MLYEAAQVLLTHSGKWSWLKAWGMRVAQRRGIRRAIVAVARRLAVVLHRMWVDGSEFRWRRDGAASYGCLNPRRKTRKNAVTEITRSAPAEKCPHGDDGWGEFVRSPDPDGRLAARAPVRLLPPHPSHPIMRRPAPTSKRSESPVWHLQPERKGDSITSSGQSLTRAAIEICCGYLQRARCAVRRRLPGCRAATA